MKVAFSIFQNRPLMHSMESVSGAASNSSNSSNTSPEHLLQCVSHSPAKKEKKEKETTEKENVESTLLQMRGRITPPDKSQVLAFLVQKYKY